MTPMRLSRFVELVSVQHEAAGDFQLVTLRVHTEAMRHVRGMSIAREIHDAALVRPAITESHARRGRTMAHSRR